MSACWKFDVFSREGTFACQTKGFPGSLPSVPWPQQLTGPFRKTVCFSPPPSAIRIRQCTPLPRGRLGRTRGARTSGTVSALLQISGLQGPLWRPITSDCTGTNATLLWNCPSIQIGVSAGIAPRILKEVAIHAKSTFHACIPASTTGAGPGQRIVPLSMRSIEDRIARPGDQLLLTGNPVI